MTDRGFMGVALRDVAGETWLLSKRRSSNGNEEELAVVVVAVWKARLPVNGRT